MSSRLAMRALLALALLCLTTVHVVVEGRLISPTDLQLQAYRHRHGATAAAADPQARIDAYFHGSGFPQAGRTLKQKISEAELFLADQIPRSGIVGVGAAIVYNDQVVLAKGYGLRTSNVSDSTVSPDSMFQIGSVTKTMLAVAIGLIVEENKLHWQDTVKTHLPWLQLFDKYAEKYVTIGDLLAMNSGFGALPDLADFFGLFPTERQYVEALEYCEPQHPLRAQPEYANVNFVILGQLIESVSGKPWYTFLRERVWEPLGMNNTYASAQEVPVELRPEILNQGHFSCDGQVLGPFDVATARSMQLSPERVGGYDAAGSVVSSASDMAIFLRLILNKGRVDNVTLFQSQATISEMVTGHALASPEILEMFTRMGLHYEADGGTISAGYGIDIIGQAIWGHAYFDKSGDVAAHQTRTGFAPHEKLAVIFMGNTQVPEAHLSYYLDHYRSYVMGIFSDVPKQILDFEFKKWRAADQLQPPFAGAPRCGLMFWENPPIVPLSAEEEEAFVGTYVATVSEKFYSNLTISRTRTTAAAGANGSEAAATTYHVEIALVSGELLPLGPVAEMGPSTTVFITHGDAAPSLALTATRDLESGAYTINLGVDYRKKP